MEDYIQVAYLKKPHGVQGYIHIEIEEVFEEDLLKAKAVFIEMTKKKVPHFIQKLDLSGKDVIKFEEYNSPETVKILSQRPVYMRIQDIEALEDKLEEQKSEGLQYLEGFQLFNQNNELIGTITEVVEIPQNVLLAVNHNDREILIPFHDDIIIKVNEKKSTISIHIIDGLLDL